MSFVVVLIHGVEFDEALYLNEGPYASMKGPFPTRQMARDAVFNFVYADEDYEVIKEGILANRIPSCWTDGVNIDDIGLGENYAYHKPWRYAFYYSTTDIPHVHFQVTVKGDFSCHPQRELDESSPENVASP